MNQENHRLRPIVGVMGSGTSAHVDRCAPLGRWLAEQGFHLLTGGGGGVMEAVSRAFHEVESREGLVIGVLPAANAGAATAPPGYPNDWVELSVRTHLHLSGKDGTDLASRNHINVLTADVVVALPGAWGTRSEVELALRYDIPLVAYLQSRTEIPQLPKTVPVVTNLDGVKAFIIEALSRAPPGQEVEV